MKHYKITDYSYVKSSGPYFKQGVKANRRPSNAVAGGNGSFYIADPPQIPVQLKCKETGETIVTNMYGPIKYNSSRKITKKYAFKVLEKLSNDTIEVNKKGYMVNLNELLEKYTE